MSLGDFILAGVQRMFSTPGLSTEITYKRFDGIQRTGTARTSTPKYKETTGVRALISTSTPSGGNPFLRTSGVDVQSTDTQYLIRSVDVSDSLPLTLSDVILDGGIEYKVGAIQPVLDAFMQVSCSKTGMAEAT